jgi:hypothetical protein
VPLGGGFVETSPALLVHLCLKLTVLAASLVVPCGHTWSMNFQQTNASRVYMHWTDYSSAILSNKQCSNKISSNKQLQIEETTSTALDCWRFNKPRVLGCLSSVHTDLAIVPSECSSWPSGCSVTTIWPNMSRLSLDGWNLLEFGENLKRKSSISSGRRRKPRGWLFPCSSHQVSGSYTSTTTQQLVRLEKWKSMKFSKW